METDKSVIYAKDLFEYCDIKKPNQMVFDQLVEIFAKFSEEIVKKCLKEILWKCSTPNGQIAGQIPKLEEIEKILNRENVVERIMYHNKEKSEMDKPDKGFIHIYKESLKLHHRKKSGLITEAEWLKLTDKLCDVRGGNT